MATSVISITNALMQLILFFGNLSKNVLSDNLNIPSLISQITQNILQNEPKVTNFNLVIESELVSSHYGFQSILKDIQIVKQKHLVYTTNIILSLSMLGNGNGSTKESKNNNNFIYIDHPFNHWEAKYHRPISLILLSSDKKWDSNNHPILLNDAHNLFSKIPGSLHHNFFLMFGRTNSFGDLRGPHKYCKYLENIIFLNLPEKCEHIRDEIDRDHEIKDREITLLTRNWNFESLIPIGRYNVDNEQLLLEIGFGKLPNYEQNPILGIVCPFCVEMLDKFLESGEWLDQTIAAMYYVSLELNATLELQGEVAVPTMDKNDEGEWDVFTTALIEESVSFSVLVKPSILRSEVIYHSNPFYYDSVSFIHALPKKAKLGSSLLVLKKPLDLQVWIAIFSTIGFLFLALEFIYYMLNRWNLVKSENPMFQTEYGSQEHKSYFTIFVLFLPLIDQNVLEHQEFVRSARDNFSRFTFGIWLISLIVLSCAYKSKLIAVIILPKFLSPPHTFQELADSEFEIGVMLYSSTIKKLFEASHSPFSNGILKRAKELSYMDNECYHSIFDGDRVCMGLSQVFDIIGSDFLTDVKKQSLFVRSKDSYFTMLGCVGITKSCPYCLEPYNKYLNYMDNTGLVDKARKKILEQHRQVGLTNAKNWVATQPQFGSTNSEDDNEGSGRQFLLLLYLVLEYGLFAALIIFLGEKLLKYWIHKLSQDRVIILA